MQIPDFESRLPAFREGFEGFLTGALDNPYVSYQGGRERIAPYNFLKAREWQHGQDVAFLITQEITSSVRFGY